MVPKYAATAASTLSVRREFFLESRMDSGLGLPTPGLELGSPGGEALAIGLSPPWDEDNSFSTLCTEVQRGLDCIVGIDFVLFIAPEGDAIKYFALHYHLGGTAMSQFYCRG